MTQDLGYLEHPLSEVEKEFNDTGKLPNKTIKGLIYEVGSLLTRLGISDARHDKSNIDLESRHQETMKATDECHRLSQLVGEKDEELDALRIQMNEIAFKCGEATGQVNTFREIEEQTAIENRLLLEKFSEAKVDAARFTTERDQSQHKVGELEKDTQKVLDSMKDMKDRVEKLSVQNISLNDENKTLKEVGLESLQIRNKLMNEKDQLQGISNKIERERDEERNKLEQIITERDKIKTKVDSLQSDKDKGLIPMQEMKETVEKLSVQNISLRDENKVLKEAGIEALQIRSKVMSEKEQMQQKAFEIEGSLREEIKTLSVGEIDLKEKVKVLLVTNIELTETLKESTEELESVKKALDEVPDEPEEDEDTV